MQQAFAMLRMRGTAALVGVAPHGAELTIPIVPFVFKEVRIISSLMGSSPFQIFLPQLARHYLDGRLKLDELISHRIRLDEINEGYAHMAIGEQIACNVIVF
jgi:S-(hydroxymethyl)glutathione dehydrogenase/alcohol dehydrogenase